VLTAERPSAVRWEATPHERPEYSPRSYPAQAHDQMLIDRADPVRCSERAEQSLEIPSHRIACDRD